MKRRAHILADNLACDYPQQCIWFDTETFQETRETDTLWHRLKFGYACYMRRHRERIWSDEKWCRFTTLAEFWDFVTDAVRDSTKLYLFCHNTSFDLPVLDVFHELPKRDYKLRSAIIDAPPTVLRFRNGSKCIMILDTLNIWRMPLKVLGQEIGLEKFQMPEDNDLGVDWETYGKRDVEIIRDACIKWWDFLEQNDYGSFAPTLAGQSMRVFRHKYMTHEILIDADENALNLTRDGYHGGRVEAFHIGKLKGNFTLLDMNSMYPHVMAVHQYPRRLAGYTRYATVADLKPWCERYAVTARVRLRTNIPFAPFRDHHKLTFPIGEYETVLNTPEIVFALANCEITEVFEVALYEKAALFTQMMYDLYQKRLEAKKAGNPVAAFMYRKIMNSFYGKWGQQGFNWIEQENIDDLTCKHWIEYDLDTHTIIKHRQLGGLVQRLADETESRDSFPSIAGHITSYARMELFRLITLAGTDNVFYCDTDSLLVNQVGKDRLQYMIDPSLMGKLSIKGEYEDVQIWGAKDYRFGERQKTKGVRMDAIWLTDNDVRQTKWSGLRGLVSSGEVDKPITKTIQKHLSRNYDKGIVLKSGRVLPLLRYPETLE